MDDLIDMKFGDNVDKLLDYCLLSFNIHIYNLSSLRHSCHGGVISVVTYDR